ncbi:unnamed protein product, partial [Prorocentrum cordatum]
HGRLHVRRGQRPGLGPAGGAGPHPEGLRDDRGGRPPGRREPAGPRGAAVPVGG